MADKIERIMGDFCGVVLLQIKGTIYDMDQVCRLKIEGRMRLGQIISKNIALVGKWLNLTAS